MNAILSLAAAQIGSIVAAKHDTSIPLFFEKFNNVEGIRKKSAS